MPTWVTPPPHTPEPSTERPFVVINDDTTQAEIAEAIGNLNASAKVCKHVVGNDEHETPWDRAHQRINVLLCEYQLHG